MRIDILGEKQKGGNVRKVWRLKEVLPDVVRAVEEREVPLVVIGKGGTERMYEELLYFLRFYYLGWTFLDGGCFGRELALCLRSHFVQGKLVEEEVDYNGCSVDVRGVDYGIIRERIEEGIKQTPGSYSLHIACVEHFREIMRDFLNRVSVLSLYLKTGGSFFPDDAVYFLTAAGALEMERLKLGREEVFFLESGNAGRFHGLFLLNGEVIPVILSLAESECLDAKVSMRIGHGFRRKGYITEFSSGGRA